MRLSQQDMENLEINFLKLFQSVLPTKIKKNHAPLMFIKNTALRRSGMS